MVEQGMFRSRNTSVEREVASVDPYKNGNQRARLTHFKYYPATLGSWWKRSVISRGRTLAVVQVIEPHWNLRVTV